MRTNGACDFFVRFFLIVNKDNQINLSMQGEKRSVYANTPVTQKRFVFPPITLFWKLVGFHLLKDKASVTSVSLREFNTNTNRASFYSKLSAVVLSGLRALLTYVFDTNTNFDLFIVVITHYDFPVKNGFCFIIS